MISRRVPSGTAEAPRASSSTSVPSKDRRGPRAASLIPVAGGAASANGSGPISSSGTMLQGVTDNRNSDTSSSQEAAVRRSNTTGTTKTRLGRHPSTNESLLLAHVLTGLHESDDDEEKKWDDDAKTRDSRKKRRGGVSRPLYFNLNMLGRRLMSLGAPASRCQERNRTNGQRRQSMRRRSAVAVLGQLMALLVVMAVVTNLWMTNNAQNGARRDDEGGWSARLLTIPRRGRGTDSSKEGRGLELLFPSNMLLPNRDRNAAGRLHPNRPSTVYAPIGHAVAEQDRREPDYGGLDIRFLEDRGEARRIHRDWSLLEGKRDRPRPTDDTNDYYYSLDDDDMRNTYRGWHDDAIHKTKRCRRTSWHRNVPVNCNNFHELDVPVAALHGGFRLVGAGSYKHVFVVNTTSTSGVPEVLVFKNFGVAAKFDTKNYERMRKDVLVAERVGPHPLIVDVYGYCGLAQLDEAMPNGGLENVALPNHDQRQYGITLDDKNHLDPRNSLLPSEKLALALDMFEAVALLHNYKGGVIVHDDIQLLQFLLTPDGKHVKLNDFNRMEVMLWDDGDQAYCRYRNGPGQGDWRSPEEFQDLPLDEKIDIFSLGNNLYSVLTGLVPFYHAKGFKEVQRLVVQGVRPYIDPRWKERSYAERQIVELIERCQSHDPGDRIDIGTAVRFLRDAIRTNTLHHLHEDKRVRTSH